MKIEVDDNPLVEAFNEYVEDVVENEDKWLTLRSIKKGLLSEEEMSKIVKDDIKVLDFAKLGYGEIAKYNAIKELNKKFDNKSK